MIKNVAIIVLVIAAVFIVVIFASAQDRQNSDPYKRMDLSVKKFLAFPSEEARSVYDFPVNIKITGRTEDKKWYKIKLSYNFIGYFEYEGWVKVE